MKFEKKILTTSKTKLQYNMNKYTETSPQQITVFGNQCFGCERHEKDVMMTFSHTDTENDLFHIHDIFLTTEQAQRLIDELTSVLTRNSVVVVPSDTKL